VGISLTSLAQDFGRCLARKKKKIILDALTLWGGVIRKKGEDAGGSLRDLANEEQKVFQLE